MIEAKIIADSVAPHGGRITTFQLKIPRTILAELNTHKMLSKSASSTRAIPLARQLKNIINDPFIPMHWGKNQSGMQAAEELKGWRLWVTRQLVSKARYVMVALVWLLAKIGLHKQIAGRYTEPWMWAHVVVTGTEFGNFFNLRYHPAAEPHFQEVAKQMWQLMEHSTPRQLKANEWHLPYVRSWEIAQGADIADLLIRSTARCARVSYLNHEGRQTTPEEDRALFQRLMGQNPKHASPSEHQAMALPVQSAGLRSGNLIGWLQHRKCIQDENMPVFKGPMP